MPSSGKEESESPDRQRTVLLVEDNPTDIYVISEVVEACGLSLRLEIARNGHEAIAYLQKLAGAEKLRCPELVLLDLNLPNASGFEVLRRLRNSARCKSTPVIVVSSSTADADRKAAELLGVQAYFQKPSKLSSYMRLEQLIKRYLAPSQP